MESSSDICSVDIVFKTAFKDLTIHGKRIVSRYELSTILQHAYMPTIHADTVLEHFTTKINDVIKTHEARHDESSSMFNKESVQCLVKYLQICHGAKSSFHNRLKNKLGLFKQKLFRILLLKLWMINDDESAATATGSSTPVIKYKQRIVRDNNDDQQPLLPLTIAEFTMVYTSIVATKTYSDVKHYLVNDDATQPVMSEVSLTVDFFMHNNNCCLVLNYQQTGFLAELAYLHDAAQSSTFMEEVYLPSFINTVYKLLTLEQTANESSKKINRRCVSVAMPSGLAYFSALFLQRTNMNGQSNKSRERIQVAVFRR